MTRAKSGLLRVGDPGGQALAPVGLRGRRAARPKSASGPDRAATPPADTTSPGCAGLPRTEQPRGARLGAGSRRGPAGTAAASARRRASISARSRAALRAALGGQGRGDRLGATSRPTASADAATSSGRGRGRTAGPGRSSRRASCSPPAGAWRSPKTTWASPGRKGHRAGGLVGRAVGAAVAVEPRSCRRSAYVMATWTGRRSASASAGPFRLCVRAKPSLPAIQRPGSLLAEDDRVEGRAVGRLDADHPARRAGRGRRAAPRPRASWP